MKFLSIANVTIALTAGLFSNLAHAVYLNFTNISVALGASMSAEPFANRTTAQSLANVIDTPSADAWEFHTQITHVWVSGGALELDFNFGTEYDVSTFHFWNYHSEGFDVDNIDLTFFDSAMATVGTLTGISPALGGSSPSDSTQIFAEDFALSFPSNVQFVNAVLTGSNGQVDFNNMGFTAELSEVPLPAAAWLFGSALLGLGIFRRKNV